MTVIPETVTPKQLAEQLGIAERAVRERAAEIAWLRSALVSLLALAEADNSPLTLSQVAVICKHTLAKYPPAGGNERQLNL
jgi:hypothetical protein